MKLFLLRGFIDEYSFSSNKPVVTSIMIYVESHDKYYSFLVEPRLLETLYYGLFPDKLATEIDYKNIKVLNHDSKFFTHMVYRKRAPSIKTRKKII